eukprot:2268465-Prymnesium_polylepis.1
MQHIQLPPAPRARTQHIQPIAAQHGARARARAYHRVNHGVATGSLTGLPPGHHRVATGSSRGVTPGAGVRVQKGFVALTSSASISSARFIGGRGTRRWCSSVARRAEERAEVVEAT